MYLSVYQARTLQTVASMAAVRPPRSGPAAPARKVRVHGYTD